ncbi:ferredoxin [Sphingomonas koreensis]|nr:ferredoxin [Sphingomonas koreensis]
MAIVHATTRDGQQLEMPAQEGLSLMEVLRDNGIEDAFALCGGCCSCATCHVYIEPDRLALLPPMSEDESDLLDGSAHRQANSRLSCQIPWSAALDGLTVTVAPQD